MKLKDKPYYLFLLSLLSGIIFWLGWPTKPFPYLMFFAFVPILIIEDHLSTNKVKRRGWKFLGYAYLSLLTWNVLTTFWIYNATAVGGIFAMAANAVLMCLPIMFFYHTKKLTSSNVGYASFVIYWIAFEYIHLNWQLSWPWLTLGNAFASIPYLVQWYEFTGALGGSLWILLANIFIFLIFKQAKDVQRGRSLQYFTLGFALIPMIYSLIIFYSYKDQGKNMEVLVIQPNIDPYEEKFEGTPKFIPYDDQLLRLITLSKNAITPNTKYIVWPETALPRGFLEDNISNEPVIEQLKTFLKEYPNVSLVTGLDTYKVYQTKALPSSRKTPDGGYWDAFNSAMQINENQELLVYHKSKLVPGVEYMPPVLTSLTIALGEAAGGLGWQNTRTVFFNKEHIGIAPVICYESIFGDFVTEYIRNGANVIFIITNDGWWGNTQGHKQHIQFASLRAIENRKSIARSANTGISGFIDQRGRILERSNYWEQKVMTMNVKVNDIKTFYTIHGDYIGTISAFGAIGMFVFAIVSGILNRNKRIKL